MLGLLLTFTKVSLLWSTLGSMLCIRPKLTWGDRAQGSWLWPSGRHHGLGSLTASSGEQDSNHLHHKQELTPLLWPHATLIACDRFVDVIYVARGKVPCHLWKWDSFVNFETTPTLARTFFRGSGGLAEDDGNLGGSCCIAVVRQVLEPLETPISDRFHYQEFPITMTCRKGLLPLGLLPLGLPPGWLLTLELPPEVPYLRSIIRIPFCPFYPSSLNGSKEWPPNLMH